MTQVLVAIDLVGGEVVRLTRGDMELKTVYGSDPVATAVAWQAAGAQWLHLVDLDGATGSGFSNAEPIRRIVEAVSIPVELGGGIRSLDAIRRWLEAGVSRVQIGTKSMDEVFLAEAVREFGDRLVATIDSLGGRVRVSGWLEDGGMPTMEAVGRVCESGVARIMFTDIDRDGTLTGPNLGAIEEVLAAVEIPVIAAGGVTDIGDVEHLAGLGLEGIVIGKALYSGKVDLAQAQRVLRDAR
ncbi:MAG: 1-(5-phosphoribosyl)-5-[(5-phosphoribosylamino)methylideneamino]imidazole-4-carboxamide isomerase [Actinomycetota bacterium]